MRNLCTVTMPIFQRGPQAIPGDKPARQQFQEGPGPYMNNPKTAKEQKRNDHMDGFKKCQTVLRSIGHT